MTCSFHKEVPMPQGNVRRRLWRTVDFLGVIVLCLSVAALPTGASAQIVGAVAANRNGAPDAFTGVSIKVLSSNAPPGGVMQFLVTLTEPKPIIITSAALSVDSTVLGPLMGVALYGPAGTTSDAAGAAVVNGNGGIAVRAVSPSGTFGMEAAVPIVALTIGVRPDAAAGAGSKLVLDPAASFWIGPQGMYAQQVKNGNFEVGGTVAISDVFPGAGLLPAGTPITVRGIGFQPGAIVEVDNAIVATTTLVDSTRIDVTLAADADLYGRRVRVRNPDFSRATYFSYLRATWIGQSARDLLTRTDPIFSPETFTAAVVSDAVGANQFLALALQNPGASPADVAVELHSATLGPIPPTTVTMPPRTRIAREVSELFPQLVTQPLPADSSLVVRSTSPVQILGLLGDDVAGTVEPVLATTPASSP